MNTKKNHVNIPIFIPELACPHKCVFCNQEKISGQNNIPAPEDINAVVEKYLATIKENTHTEIAFFGGSFTGIPINLQEKYLQQAYNYVKSGDVESVRLSTRPDYINTEILQLLKKFGVKTIELGAQSTDNDVLLKSGRGHSFEDIKSASELIKKFGFNLGLQMMIGLPGDTKEKCLKTALDIVEAKADNTRIYPTIVVKDTYLEKMFAQKKYIPLSISQAVEITKEVYKIFEHNKVTVLRVGLHHSDELTPEKSYVAGPLHNSFKELVLSDIWKDILLQKITCDKKYYHFAINSSQINYATGFKKSNIIFFAEKGIKIKFSGKPDLEKYQINDCGN